MRVTSRGWGLLAGGSALALTAAALQSMTTARIAAVVLAIPLVAVLWSLGSRVFAHRRGLRRVLRPVTWQVDVAAAVELETTGPPLPPWSSLRERVPSSLRRRSLGARGYAVLPSRRGRLLLGPAILQRSDPLAITTWRTAIGGATEVLVWPRTEHVDDAVIARALEASDPRPVGQPQRTLEDLTVREYRRGDDLHRVHWRSTARHGQMMVRHDEPATTRVIDVGLILSEHDDEVAEWAVSAAASLALALLRNGYTVRVVTVAGGVVTGTESTLAADALDVLAVAEPASGQRSAVLRTVQRATSAGVVVVLDRPDPDLADVIVGGSILQQSTALVVDPDDESKDLVSTLHRSGWNVATTAGWGSLAQTWHTLERADV